MVPSLLQLMEVVMQHAVLVVPGESSGSIVSSAGDWFTLKELQGHVGGYVELVKIPTSLITVGELVTDIDCLLVDEDAQMKKLELNACATAVAGVPIAGPVLFANSVVLK